MRVVIAEDQVLLREGLARLFEDGGHEVVQLLGSADGLLATVEEHEPDLVVLDIRMPPSFSDEGARAARELKDTRPAIGVLAALAARRDEPGGRPRDVRWLRLPVEDRVLEVAEFLATAERVARGGSALDPKVVARLVARPDDDERLGDLTEREREVLGLMAEGLTNTGIAGRLFLSERTVEAHVRHVLLKLGVPESGDAHRRVLAVLTYLKATQRPVA